MSQSKGGLPLKRKRPGSDDPTKNLTPEERPLYNLIRSKGDMGIWKGDIRKELNIANLRVIDNSIKSLISKQMIKEVANIQAKGKKRLMAVEFEPSKDLTGGVWYGMDGNLDTAFIDNLTKVVRASLSRQKVATADGLCHAINNSGGFAVELTVEQLKEILANMVSEKEIVQVKSKGLGEFAGFPIGADCFKLKPRSTKVGALASVPCGVCPRINQCNPDGIISPATCVYYTKWLEF